MREAASFVPLWCTSTYSFLRGASHPEELLRQAAEYGYAAFGLCDRDSLSGVVRAHSEQAILRGEGVEAPRLVVGAEITLESGAGRCVVALLARNRNGYGNLSELVSRARRRAPKGQAWALLDDFAELHADMELLWLGPYAQPYSLEPGAAEKVLVSLQGWFDDPSIVIARHHRAADLQYEALMHHLAQATGISMVAAPQVLYHHSDRRPLHDVLTCIRLGCTLDTAGTRLPPNALHAMPTNIAVGRLYRDLPAAVERSVQVAARCTFELSEIEYRYPSEERPDGYSDHGWLTELTRRGALKRYFEAVPQSVHEQLRKELGIIEQLRYSGYFLTMYEIVDFCRRNGILCQGRGSAANSAVCYCLGITAVDPIRMNLLFERFLSIERAEPPDIDLDIQHNRREEVIRHVYSKYGRDRAAMVANMVRYRRRSAVRDVGKVFGLPLTTLDRICTLLGARGLGVEEAAREAGLDIGSSRVGAFLTIVQQIREVPRHLSIHPGGFLLGNEPVHRLVPIENATMPGRTVIQWDKYDIEDMNLFKVDLLGLGALTHLDCAFRLLERYLGISLTIAGIPPHCAATFALIQRADTIGVFQLESRAQMAMLPRLRPHEFYDIVVEVSIVRPGPITGGMVHPYLRRRAGLEQVVYPHPSLEQILKKTLGVPLFQEQVMRLAIVAADYTPGEADQLRRDMAAWRRSGRIEKHRDRLIERMTAKGIERTFAEQVFDQIRGFGEYGFPESHAASFALLAYATAWVRAHYPVVFTCALLNAWPMGFYSPASIVADARRHGIEVRPVDVLRSEWFCTLEPCAASTNAKARVPKAGTNEIARAVAETPVAGMAPIAAGDAAFAVRMGLRFVKGMGETDARKVVEARAELGHAVLPQGTVGGKLRAGARERSVGALRRLIEGARRDQDAVTALARAGAFSPFGVGRRTAVWEALGCRNNRTDADDSYVDPPPPFRSLSRFEQVAWDYDTASHSARAHPLESQRPYLEGRGIPSAEAVRSLPNGARSAYVGMVICRQRPDTAGGTVFFTLEDETGFVNLVIWQRVFERFRTNFLTESFLYVEGRIQSEDGVVHLVVESCGPAQLPNRLPRLGSRDFH